MSGLPVGADAKQTLHEYTTATFASSGDHANVESSDFTDTDLTQPTRANNVTQIFVDWVRVSGTEMAVNTVQDAWSYQINKNMTEHARDVELALMGGSRASGLSGTARRLAGIKNALTTNRSTMNSGQSLGETNFNDVLNLIYTSGTNDVGGEVFVGGTLKRVISGFTAGNTKNINADDKRLIRAIDIYESDFGLQKLFLHRDVRGVNTGNRHELVIINPKYHVLSFLTGRRTKMEKVAKVGDHERAQIITEMTVEHRGEKTGAFVDGWTH